MLKYFINTFGCQMNKHDSEIIEAQLQNKNFIKTDNPSTADIIIVNTCAVREHSSHKAISTMGKYLKYKKKNKNLICAFIGCVAQAEKLDLLKSLPEIDILLGPQDIHLFFSILDTALNNHSSTITHKFSEYSNYLSDDTPHYRPNNFPYTYHGRSDNRGKCQR